MHSPVSDIIPVPGAPEVQGLSFRRFRQPEDFQNMATIARACAQVDGIERADTAEELAATFEHLTNCDPATDMLFATLHSGNGQAPQVIGYSRVTWREEGSGDRWYIFFGRIVPEWRRKGIGQAMLGWVESRLKQIAGSHPPHIRKHFVCFAEQGEQGFAAMLEKSGYQPMRYSFEMLRPDLENIPDFPMPEGLEVRPVLPEHYRLIWEADTEAFRDHWGFVEPSEDDYQAWLKNPIFFQPHLWQVAWDVASNEIAGQVRTYIDHEQNQLYNRKRGYTEFISVRRPWRRIGLARALIVRSLQAQKDAGMTESALWVDSENLSGANMVYEACGFVVHKRATVYHKQF